MLLISFAAFAQQDTTKTKGEIHAFDAVDVKPTFQGQDAGTFAYWVAHNLKYPEVAAKNGICGRVLVEFVVEKDGSITDVKALKSPDESLSEEAVRVISNSPEWEPGIVDGKPVRVRYMFPVVFKL